MTEAKMSGNIRGYYKGYSIQITNRDPEVEVKPLLEKMLVIADYMEENGFKPSWNEGTNKGVTPAPAPDHVQNQLLEAPCTKCGAKTAISKKGNVYCTDKCWLPENKR